MKENKEISDFYYILSADYLFNPNYIKDYLNLCLLADNFKVTCENEEEKMDVVLPYFTSQERNLKINVTGGSETFRIKSVKMMEIVQTVCENDFVVVGDEYVNCNGQTVVAEDNGIVGMRSELPSIFQMETLYLPKDTYYYDSEGVEHKTTRAGNYEVRVEEIPYDNGLNFRINKENNEIILISKGIPFLTTQAYYVIETCHEEKLSIPTQRIQTDATEEDYGTFIDLTEEEIIEYEKQMTCRYFIKYQIDNEIEIEIPNELLFNWRGEVKYFEFPETTVNTLFSVSEDWCHIDTDRAFRLSISCDANNECERECIVTINGQEITIRQEPRQYLYKEDNVNFGYNEEGFQTYEINDDFASFEKENNTNWCHCQQDTSNSVKISCDTNTSIRRRSCWIVFKNTCDTIVGRVVVIQESEANQEPSDDKYMQIYNGENLVSSIRITKDGEITTFISDEYLNTLYRNKEHTITFYIKTQTFADSEWSVPVVNSTISVARGAKWIEIDQPMTYEENEPSSIIISSDEDNNYGVNRLSYMTFKCNSDNQLSCRLLITQTTEDMPTN